MAGYVMKMNTLVPIIDHSGQKDLSFKVRHKSICYPLWARLGKKQTKINWAKKTKYFTESNLKIA